MKLLDPGGFDIRWPEQKKIDRKPIVSIGPNEQWSADGHDKLKQIGFPIYGFRDVWSANWLKAWVVPDNRLQLIIAYLLLWLIWYLGGLSLSFALWLVDS